VCAWLALTPLVVAVVSTPQPRTRRTFLLGLLSGAVYFSGTLYWLVATMTTFGGLPTAGAVVAAGLLVAYLSLFPAAFALVLGRLHARFGPRALLLAPSIWVATELGRQYVWDGFPWTLLGYSLVTTLPIAQLASIVGVYGLSALLALVSTAAALRRSVLLESSGFGVRCGFGRHGCSVEAPQFASQCCKATSSRTRNGIPRIEKRSWLGIWR
jgi:apolipoprotein N-acyltransferase